VNWADAFGLAWYDWTADLSHWADRNINSAQNNLADKCGYFSVPINNSLSVINMVAQLPDAVANIGTATGTSGYVDEPLLQPLSRLGEGAGTFVGSPSLENATGFAQDISTIGAVGSAALGALPSVRTSLTKLPAAKRIPRITEKGLSRVESHLDSVLNDQFSDLPRKTQLKCQAWERAMLERLRSGATSSQDIEFYMHELKESALFRASGDLQNAHVEALKWRDIGLSSKESQPMLFHPEVLQLRIKD
jgi:hypothetical protein